MVHRDDIVIAQLLSTYQPSVGADCDWHVPELTWRGCKQDDDIIIIVTLKLRGKLLHNTE